MKNTSWVQFADITGVWGASFLIVLANIIVFRIVVYFKQSGKGIIHLKNVFSDRNIRNNLILLSAIIIIPIIYGFFSVRAYDHQKLMKENPSISVGLIQPNINPWRKWETNAINQILQHQRIQDSLTNLHPKTDLFVWSETAITVLSLEINSSHNFSFMNESLDSSNSSLLTGFADIYFYKPGEKHLPTSKKHRQRNGVYYDSYNSAVLINPSKYHAQAQIYHKMKLTPFGERIPYVEFYTVALKWLEWGVGISSWALGTEQKALELKNTNPPTKVGSIICIESIYPSFVANFVKKGAEFLTIITNDAWYDHTFGPEQHFQIACMRAIETKRYIARCANTGVSGFIRPTGESFNKLEPYVSSGTIGSIPLLKNETIFVRFGDWLPYLCTFVSLVMVFYSLFRPKNKQKKY